MASPRLVLGLLVLVVLLAAFSAGFTYAKNGAADAVWAGASALFAAWAIAQTTAHSSGEPSS